MPADETLWIDVASWTATVDSGSNSQWAITGEIYGWTSDAGYPHWLTVDLGSPQTFDQLMWPFGQLEQVPAEIEVYVSDDGTTWGTAIATATFGDQTTKYVRFPRQTKSHIKLVGVSGLGTNTQMGCDGLRLLADFGISHYGWTISASSTWVGYGAEKAIDGLILDGNYWNSTGPAPQWLAVDMGQTQEIDFVRFWPDRHTWVNTPHLVSLAISDNGTDWEDVATTPLLWPVSDEDQYLYLATPRETRYFKLSFVSSTEDYVTCAEICAGLREVGQTYKTYYKVYPQQSAAIYPNQPEDPANWTGQINSLHADGYSANMSGSVWKTSGTDFYPEAVFWDWRFPIGWESKTFEAKLMVVQGSQVDGAVVATISDFQLSYEETSIQSYFDYLYPWYYNASFSGYAFNDVADLTAAELLDTYSHVYHWHSLLRGPDVLDPSMLTISDHYIMLVYEEAYAPPSYFSAYYTDGAAACSFTY